MCPAGTGEVFSPAARTRKSFDLAIEALWGPGGCLSSRAVASQVLSVYVSLTSVFGMGTGGTSQLNHRKGWVHACVACVSTLKTAYRNSLGESESCVEQALDLLVSVSLTHHCAYTSDLST